LAGEALAARGGIVLLALALFVFLTVPLAMIFARSVEGRAGEFVGLANFAQYVQSPSLAQSTHRSSVGSQMGWSVGQSVSSRHPTQAWVTVLQSGVSPSQSPLAAHSVSQVNSFGKQAWPAPQSAVTDFSSRRDQDNTIVKVNGQDELYVIPDAVIFGG